MPRASQLLTLSAVLAVLAFVHPRAASGQSSTDETLQEVTVTAQRANVAKQVRKFVNQIAAQENEEGLPLWTQPVCPSVSGMNRQQGEFVLWRISEIARGAKIPLAGERCAPNLFILLTGRPEYLLRSMKERNRVLAFGYQQHSNVQSGETPDNVIEEFITTPRAVRVWYNTDWRDSWGMTIGCSITGVCSTSHAEATRVQLNVVYSFSRVFEIVDVSRLHGVTLRQFADYAGMEGLAKLKPYAGLGDSNTILRLFDAAPGAAPAAMTDWDQAFLKSLYTTDQRVIQQRGKVANTVVQQLAR